MSTLFVRISSLPRTGLNAPLSVIGQGPLHGGHGFEIRRENVLESPCTQDSTWLLVSTSIVEGNKKEIS